MLSSMPVSQRLECLIDLMSCTGRMYSWTYNAEGRLEETNCPDRVLDNVFSSTGCMDAVLKHSTEHRNPIMLSIPYGLSWSAAFEFEEDTLKKIYVFGPVSPAELSHDGISKAVQSAKIPHHWRPKFIKILKQIPVVSTIDFFRHTLMLHFCVTGEKLTNADIVFYEPALKRGGKEATPKKDRMNTYMR